MVNTNVVPQRKWRQLKTSIVLGDYDMKVKFIPSVESPDDYKIDIILDEENPSEEEVEIPVQYKERAQNWKMQMRKRSTSGRVEKFYYKDGVKKSFRTVKAVSNYILHGPTPRKSSKKRKGEASTSKNEKKAKEKKAKEEEIAEEDISSNKEESHASSKNGEQSDADDEGQSYEELLRYVD
ncbi:PREDICTED: uncharacterized protein LOC109156773 [Ipomoea nil]|uniref:uncharacterized protein LOC109156773 n=1 Tax=Ipomoea nil TaxID=35883 RepID=UPI00090086BD|nr:PREDICTED: uncharacterized protein LOC109156773 [Ipomoea nil]XP_019160151.1 PREDICTED: uncharacterized protein LOC109156773 [Ipomoea nil]